MPITVSKTSAQVTIEPDKKLGYRGKEADEGSKGKASVIALQRIFKQSPLPGYTPSKIKVVGEAEDLDTSSHAAYKAWFLKNVTKGKINDEAYGLGEWSLDYQNQGGPPNLSDVATGGRGRPATPFVPNPVSPGEGSVRPEDQAAAPKEFIEKQTPDSWGSGASVAKPGQGIEADPDRNPTNTTKKIKDKIEAG